MRKILLTLVLFSSLFMMSFVRADDTSPVGMLQNIADRMIAGLKAHKASLKKNPAVVYSLANSIVVPHADITYMAQRVLPPSTWNKATSAQKEKFKKEFTKLLVRTYASALSDYSNQTVKFYPLRGGYQGKSTVTVSSQIVREDGPPVSVTYRLVSHGSVWKLYDLSVEGVSLIESFRSQFADKLSKGDMEALLNDLVKHNNARGA